MHLFVAESEVSEPKYLLWKKNKDPGEHHHLFNFVRELSIT